MIYEVRTYDMKPGAVPQAEEAFAEALPYREKYSPIAAFWHTEIGPLNQIIHVWGYESLEERASIRAAAGMRTYTYQPGSMPELLRRWAEALPYREEFSPLAAGMYTEFGGLNKWLHIWPYKDLNHRAETRVAASKIPQWPSGAPGRVSQENKIVAPASFSPMH